MTNTEGTPTKNENWMPDGIFDKYKITYHYIMDDGKVGAEETIEALLFTFPDMLKVWAKHGAKVIFTSIEQISEGEE